MSTFNRHTKHLAGAAALGMLALAAACGGSGAGSRAPVLGIGDGTAALTPLVTAVNPANLAPAVPVNQTVISAGFNEPMAPFTGPATFTVTSPGNNPAGAVALDPTSRIASFTLTPGTILVAGATYTATITGARSLDAGLPMAAPYTWTFTAGTAPLTGPPTVSAVTPANNATGVPTNGTSFTVAFSEPINTVTSATFTLTAPGQAPTGTLAFDASNRNATFTLAAGTSLAPLTTYTATVAGARSLATGIAMAAPFTWTFKTGSTASSTRPSVTQTAPATTLPGPTLGAPANAAISAVFSQDMAPASISSGSFQVTCPVPGTLPTGIVTYDVGSRTAVFTPFAPLTVGTTYTATLTTAATNLTGSALGGNQAALPAASDYVWSFTAGAPVVPAQITVLSTNPAANALNVSPSASINATFQLQAGLRLNPSTVNPATFTLAGPFPSSNQLPAASVVLDTATGTIVTFTPLLPLTTGDTYTATITGGSHGVMDLALPGDDLTSNYTWSFTVGAQTLPPTIALGSIAPFGNFGGSAGTTNTGLKTVINGDVGTTAVSTAVTGFHDAGFGDTYTETPLNSGLVNGKIYTDAPPPTAGSTDEGNATTAAIALQGSLDATTAYHTLALMPTGPYTAPANLGSLTLLPGVYQAAGGTFMIEGGDLTLDAQGDSQAVWVFQMAETLTVGGPGAAFPQSVILLNGAQAKNVFWQVGSAATINAAGGGTMVGTIIAMQGIAISTYGNTIVVTLNGRAISLVASVTLVDTIVNVPAN
jgi:hypothetical protein